MMYSGSTLEKWKTKLVSKKKRNDFMVKMLRQIILGMKKIHKAGYTHNDLKTDNICVTKSADGSFKFTLIDFGMCSKIASLGDSY